jgi:hypothetical protein
MISKNVARCAFETRTLFFNDFRPDYQPKNTSVNFGDANIPGGRIIRSCVFVRSNTNNFCKVCHPEPLWRRTSARPFSSPSHVMAFSRKATLKSQINAVKLHTSAGGPSPKAAQDDRPRKVLLSPPTLIDSGDQQRMRLLTAEFWKALCDTARSVETHATSHPIVRAQCCGLCREAQQPPTGDAHTEPGSSLWLP